MAFVLDLLSSASASGCTVKNKALRDTAVLEIIFIYSGQKLKQSQIGCYWFIASFAFCCDKLHFIIFLF